MNIEENTMEISKMGVSIPEIKQCFQSKVSAIANNADLIAIFNIAIKSEGLSLFPKINGKSNDYKIYIDKWISQYVAAKQRSSLTHRHHRKVQYPTRLCSR